jgi:hypothetical protein
MANRCDAAPNPRSAAPAVIGKTGLLLGMRAGRWQGTGVIAVVHPRPHTEIVATTVQAQISGVWPRTHTTDVGGALALGGAAGLE